MIGNRVRLAVALALGSGLAPLYAAEAQSVPDAPDSLARAGNAIVIALPDTWGYTINQQPVARDELGSQFSAIYGPRPHKVLLISWGATRTRDIALVVHLAKERGITVYRARERAGEL
jgi:hypothetical protein